MKKILKGKEPNEWTEYRMAPGAQCQAIPELVKSLLEEQGYICAYCMRRIPCKDGNSSEDHRIDHISCRANNTDDQLNYKNMVICCPGAIEGKFHCDKKKGSSNISFTPFDDVFINSIKYKSSDGEISSTDNQWNQEINEILNLNHDKLKENRLTVLNSTISFLGKKSWTQSEIKKEFDKWNSKDKDGKFKPYCGVVLWFLNKRLKLSK